MKTLASTFALAAVAAIVLPVTAAVAETVIPPGNSAANQYTETFPTWEGNDASTGHQPRAPAEALGKRNAKKLEALGSDGRAAAAFAAATAPRAASGRSAPSRENRAAVSPDMAGAAEGSRPGGSSGWSEVLGQAVGSSDSGRLGLLLPLVVVGSLVLSVAFALRRRRHVA